MTPHSPYCPAQTVPTFDDLHRMAQVFLAQNMGAGVALVLGAGAVLPRLYLSRICGESQ